MKTIVQNDIDELFNMCKNASDSMLLSVIQSEKFKKLPLDQKIELDKKLRSEKNGYKPVLFPSKEDAQKLVMEFIKQRKEKGRNDTYVLGLHVLNVASIAEKGAQEIGLDPEIAYTLGVLHDIGRISTRPERVNKDGDVCCHPVIGYDFLNGKEIVHTTTGEKTSLKDVLTRAGLGNDDLDIARFSSCAFIPISHNYQRADFSAADFTSYEKNLTFPDFIKTYGIEITENQKEITREIIHYIEMGKDYSSEVLINFQENLKKTHPEIDFDTLINEYKKEGTDIATQRVKEIISVETGIPAEKLKYDNILSTETSQEELDKYYVLTKDAFGDYDKLIQYADMSSQDYQILDMDKRIENNLRNYGPNSCSMAAKYILPKWFEEKVASMKEDTSKEILKDSISPKSNPWEAMLQKNFNLSNYRYTKLPEILKKNIELVNQATATGIENNALSSEEILLGWVCNYGSNVNKIYDNSLVLSKFASEKVMFFSAEKFLVSHFIDAEKNNEMSLKEDFYARIYGKDYNKKTTLDNSDKDSAKKLLLKVVTFEVLAKKLNDNKDIESYPAIISKINDRDLTKQKEKRKLFVNIVGRKGKVDLVPKELKNIKFNPELLQEVAKTFKGFTEDQDIAPGYKKIYKSYLSVLTEMMKNRASTLLYDENKNIKE